MGGRETVGILTWVTFKTLLGNRLDTGMYIVGGRDRVGILTWVTFKTLLGNRLDTGI